MPKTGRPVSDNSLVFNNSASEVLRNKQHLLGNWLITANSGGFRPLRAARNYCEYHSERSEESLPAIVPPSKNASTLRLRSSKIPTSGKIGQKWGTPFYCLGWAEGHKHSG